MKWILAILLVISGSTYGQIGQGDDSTKYIRYQYQYGSRMPRYWADSALHIPYYDTARFKPQKAGAIMMHLDKNVYKWNGGGWDPIVIGGATLNNVGTGFRRVTTPNGSIKSDIYGYGLNGDSASTANTITINADTSELVTPSDLKDTAAALRSAIAGISGTPGGVDQDVQYNNSSTFGGSTAFKWNNSSKRLSIFNTASADLTSLNDHNLKIIGNRIYLGDTTSNAATFFEFGNPYGAANGKTQRMTFGWMGTQEFNRGINFHYRGDVHLKYDNTDYAVWDAFNTDYWLVQAQGIGYDWNDNAGSKIPARIDFLKTGNRYVGGRISTNDLYLFDMTTSDYQQLTGRRAAFTVANASLNIGGVQSITIPDTTQLLIGPVNDGTTPDLGIQSALTNTVMTLRNDINSSATNRIRMIKSRAGSFNLTTGDVIFDLQAQTLCSYQMVASDASFSTFKLPEHRWTTAIEDGNEFERVRIGWNGTFMINTSSTAANIRNRRLYINGSIGANKDSIDLQTTASTRQMVVIDTATGKFQRMDIPSTSGITSINSKTGPAITIQSGTATSIDNSVSNTVTVNVTPSSNSIPHTLDAQYTTTGNTGTSETDLYSYTVPANKLSIDGRTVNFEIDGEFNDNTATAQLKLYFGGNVTLNTGAVNISTANTGWRLKGYIIRTSSTTAHVTYELHAPGLATTLFVGYNNLTSLDFTAGNIFKVTAQAGGAGAGNNDITAHSWQVLYKPQPQ